MKLKRIFSYALIGCILFSVCLFSASVPSKAANNTLTVKAGYFGLEYVTKAEFSVGELESIGVHTQFYSMITGGNYVQCANVEGVYLSDILDASGINLSSVRRLNFTASDNWYASKDFSYSKLFGGGKYAFHNLSEYYSVSTGVTDYDAVWNSAQPVESMMSIRDNLARVGDFSPFVPGEMSGDRRFRLYIGQTSPDEIAAAESIHGVHTIIVTYSGSPEIVASSDVKVSIGDNKKLDVSVKSADTEISKLIQAGLKYKSSDNSILSVDSTGKLTARKEGEVEITIYYEAEDASENITKTVKVVVGEGNDTGGGNDGGGTGTGTGSGSSDNKTDTGTGNKPSSSTNTGSSNKPTYNTNTGNKTDSNSSQATDADEEVYIATEAGAQKTDSNSSQATDADEEVYITTEAGAQKVNRSINVRRVQLTGTEEEASEESVQAEGGSEALGVEMETNWTMIMTGISAVALFFCGGLGMYIKFRKSI